jgi:hypothetical protein
VHCYTAFALQSRQQLLGKVSRHIVLELPGLPQQLLLLLLLLLLWFNSCQLLCKLSVLLLLLGSNSASKRG